MDARRAVQSVHEARSGRAPFVPMVEASDLGDRYDVAITGRHDRTGNRRVLLQTQMGARLFVVRNIPSDHAPEMRRAEDDDVI